MGRNVCAPCLSEPQVVWTKDQVRQLFKSYDRNRDGKISKEELKAAFKELGSRWTAFRAMRALCYVDTNGDGYVSEDGFNGLVKYTLECGYMLK